MLQEADLCYKNHFDNCLLILQHIFYFFDITYWCMFHKLFSQTLFHNSSHSSEYLFLYVLGKLLMCSMHGVISLFPKWRKLVSVISFFGSSSCTVNDSAGIISGPGSVFFLSLSVACNTSSLLAVPIN